MLLLLLQPSPDASISTFEVLRDYSCDAAVECLDLLRGEAGVASRFTFDERSDVPSLPIINARILEVPNPLDGC